MCCVCIYYIETVCSLQKTSKTSFNKDFEKGGLGGLGIGKVEEKNGSKRSQENGREPS